MDGDLIDVNVHPTKMELRFQRQQEVYNTVYEAVHRRLLEPELVQTASIPDPVAVVQKKKESPFLLKPKPAEKQSDEAVHDEDYFIKKMQERVKAYHERSSSAEVSNRSEIYRPQQTERIREAVTYGTKAEKEEIGNIQLEVQKEKAGMIPPEIQQEEVGNTQPEVKKEESGNVQSETKQEKPKQLDLFEENFLKREMKAEYQLIGQVFDTYWLVQFQDSLYIIDQHAAHERVMYERTLKEMKSREYTSQYLSPPIILSLSMQEAQLLNEHMDRFTRIGFEIEPFGGEEYAVRAVPDNLFSIAKKELLMEMIDDLADGINTSMTPELIDEKIASMSCKAAVKGNNRLSAQEVDALIGELLTLENPYHCPHGRPTIIAMTKRELEKKFKRIV